MRKSEEKLFKNIIMTPSPSGYEGQLANLIKKELINYIPRTKIDIDFHNNVVVRIDGKTNQKVMIDAHSDQLGFMVFNIDKEGYVSLIPIGGHDKSIIRGRKVLILPEKGKPFEAVIGTKHAHLIDDDSEDDLIPNKTTDVTLDIGVRKIKQVKKYLSIGDPLIMKPELNNIIEDYYTGTGFDDKTGVYVLIQTIKEIRRQHKKPIPTLLFSFSSQEEIGCKGAKELARRHKPDLFVGIDVTCATDSYEIDEREAGRCDLGKGITIIKGVNIHKPSLKLMQSLARCNKVRVQYQANNGDESTDADVVGNELDGIRILNLGIPCRNLHSPVEIINIKDLNYATRLLKSFLLSRKLGKVIEK
jgi:endoglucanase